MADVAYKGEVRRRNYFNGKVGLAFACLEHLFLFGRTDSDRPAVHDHPPYIMSSQERIQLVCIGLREKFRMSYFDRQPQPARPEIQESLELCHLCGRKAGRELEKHGSQPLA